MTDYDIVIVGGAAMGSATAYYLTGLSEATRVAVVERDARYARSSTLLSEGNVRIQFNLPENIQISKYAFEVLASFPEDMAIGGMRPEVGTRQQGNLFLAGAENRDAALAGLEAQQELGCEVHWMDATEIASRWPPYAARDSVGGTFGPNDGSFDPTGVLRGYRSQALSRGAEYIEAEVTEILIRDEAVAGVRLADGSTITAPVVLNCAGAWSMDLLRPLGVDLPVEPVMRTVYVVDTRVEAEGLPSLFLPSGLYLITEHGTTFTMGWSQPDDPVGFDFTPNRSRFEDLLWPELATQLSAFDELRVTSSWAGLYAVNTLDGNGIFGEWPTITGLYVCTGFSGHGFQQCHAVGRYLAEVILDVDVSLDLSRLGPQRIIEGQPLFEHAGRLI